jgi:hypothetical protein
VVNSLYALRLRRRHRQRPGLLPHAGPSNGAGSAAGEHSHVFGQNSSRLQTVFATERGGWSSSRPTSAVCEYQPLCQAYELEDLDVDTDTDIDMVGLDRDTAIIVGLSDAKKGEFENEKNL